MKIKNEREFFVHARANIHKSIIDTNQTVDYYSNKIKKNKNEHKEQKTDTILAYQCTLSSSPVENTKTPIEGVFVHGMSLCNIFRRKGDGAAAGDFAFDESIGDILFDVLFDIPLHGAGAECSVVSFTRDMRWHIRRE
jgi:hypothetical protein